MNRLEERFEDATPEELTEAHECLICREGMDRGKKLPCKHVFHLHCLKMWLQHQQTCPLCRSILTHPRLFSYCSLSRAEIPIVSLPTPNGAATPVNGTPVPAPAAVERPLFVPNREFGHRENLLPAPAARREDLLDYPPRYFLDELPEALAPSTEPTSPQTIKKAVPGFFVVLAAEDQPVDQISIVEVKTDPSYSPTNPTLRTLNQVEFSSVFSAYTSAAALREPLCLHQRCVWFLIQRPPFQLFGFDCRMDGSHWKESNNSLHLLNCLLQ